MCFFCGGGKVSIMLFPTTFPGKNMFSVSHVSQMKQNKLPFWSRVGIPTRFKATIELLALGFRWWKLEDVSLL